MIHAGGWRADYDAEEYTADCRGRGGTYYRQRVAEEHAQDVRSWEYVIDNPDGSAPLSHR